MPATPSPTATDYLKYVAAKGKQLLEHVDDQLGWLQVEHPEIGALDDLLPVIGAVRELLNGAVAAASHDSRDRETYSDGRAVRALIELETGTTFHYQWHPEPSHSDNRPHTVIDGLECNSGCRRSVIVSADQVLDVVTHGPALHLVSDHE